MAGQGGIQIGSGSRAEREGVAGFGVEGKGTVQQGMLGVEQSTTGQGGGV